MPPNISRRIKTYLENKLEKEAKIMDENSAISLLSDNLRDEVRAFVNTRLLESIPLI